ncbi:MAG TPA: SDR family oxidoreductase, partial [Deltaproteobacteria bacterium]|nr:SDR family oxidoreductase [Deltaproteobacteria bacterium]
TREWALALAPEGIRVNCVLPAECLTDQYKRFFQSQANPDAVQKNIGKLVPLEQRLTTPEEIAHTVVFLHPFVPRTPRVNSSSWTADTPLGSGRRA